MRSRRAWLRPFAARKSAFSPARASPPCSELKRSPLPGAVRTEARAPPLALDRQFHVQPVGRQVVAEFLGPLDHRRALVQRLVEAELGHLLELLQPVEVEVRQRERL